MKKLSRRDALKLIGLTTAGSVLAACKKTPATTAPEPTKPPEEKPPAFEPTEAPKEPEATKAVEPTPVPTKAPPPELPEIEIKVSLWDIAMSFPEGEPDVIAKLVSDMFKVKLTPVNVGWGDAEEKYDTWAASGQLPDIIGGIAMPGEARYLQWINDGVVRPLPDV